MCELGPNFPKREGQVNGRWSGVIGLCCGKTLWIISVLWTLMIWVLPSVSLFCVLHLVLHLYSCKKSIKFHSYKQLNYQQNPKNKCIITSISIQVKTNKLALRSASISRNTGPGSVTGWWSTADGSGFSSQKRLWCLSWRRRASEIGVGVHLWLGAWSSEVGECLYSMSFPVKKIARWQLIILKVFVSWLLPRRGSSYLFSVFLKWLHQTLVVV